MKRASLALLALAILSACDSHTWEETKPLYMDPPEHGAAHTDKEGAAAKGHEAPSSVEKKAEH